MHVLCVCMHVCGVGGAIVGACVCVRGCDCGVCVHVWRKNVGACGVCVCVCTFVCMCGE